MRKRGNYLFTSESVSEGHPDKICDQISDAVLDAVLAQDPRGRCACECLCTTGLVVVAGEITFDGAIDIPAIVRNTLREIGYLDATLGISAEFSGIIVAVNKQSPDIALGVDREGAGDQGMMFGFAVDETPELMPFPIMASHRLLHRLTELRKNKTLAYLGPDAKSQVTVEYFDNKPARVHTVVISTQHRADVAQDQIRRDAIDKVIRPVLGDMVDERTVYHINPTGRFVTGGPHGDSGLTGRKIIVDTYGGMGRHGGGAFSGKDPTKVDRSGAYMARYIAKNIVAAGLATRCEIQISYAIGIRDALSVFVDCFGTEKYPEEAIERAVKEMFDLTPRGMIETLGLRKPMYSRTSVYGHFGREEFPWEQTDRAKELGRRVAEACRKSPRLAGALV